MVNIGTEKNEAADQLTISVEKVFCIIVKAREFDEQVAPTDPESGSNPTDDRNIDVLEAQGDDPTLQELEAALSTLNIDEQLDLLGLLGSAAATFPLSNRRGERRRTSATSTFHHTSSAHRSSETIWKRV